MEEERTAIFTNTYRATEETYRQLYARIRRGFTCVVTALALVAIVYITWSIVRFSMEYAAYGESFFKTLQAWFLLILTVYLAVNIVLLLLSPKRLAKKALNRMRELNNNEIPEEHAAFYADAATFSTSTNTAATTLQYQVFTKILETKDLFLLWTKQKQVIPLDKNGFAGTDIAGFRAFMDANCPDAKRKWSKGA